MSKIGIIGAGDIGFNIAEILMMFKHHIKIYNRKEGNNSGSISQKWLSKLGKIKDLQDAVELCSYGSINLTSELDDLLFSDFIIITSGAKRISTEISREELCGQNMKILNEYLPLIKKSKALVLIVTNPVDILTSYLIEEALKDEAVNKEDIISRIIGVSYVDTMRFKTLIKQALIENGYSINSIPKIEAVVVGEHGSSMVPLLSSVRIGGEKIEAFLSKDICQKIVEDTILRGNDIIKLTGTSSVKGPAHAVINMIQSIDTNDSINLPASIWDGERAIGRLACFASRRFRMICNLKMSEQEEYSMQKSIENIDKFLQKVR